MRGPTVNCSLSHHFEANKTNLFDVTISPFSVFYFVLQFKSFSLQDDEYRNMGRECVRKAFTLLESSEWNVEKVTTKGDTIQSTQQDKLGKVFRLTVSTMNWCVLQSLIHRLNLCFYFKARIHFPAKKLLEHLFYKIEDIPKWNPTILESKIIRVRDNSSVALVSLLSEYFP